MALTAGDLAQIQAMIDGAIPSGQGFSDAITAGAILLIPAIQSPNYVLGISGWTINKDGTVEFNSGTFRGTISAGVFAGTDFTINSLGAFFYNGTPATGNLFASIAAAAGANDGQGNAFQGPGMFFYSLSGDGGYIGLTKTNTGQVIINLGNTAAGASPAFLELTANVLAIGWPGNGGQVQLNSGNPGYVSIASPIFANGGTPANPTTITTDTWHNFSLAAGWTVGTDSNGTAYPPAYQLLPDGAVALRGCLVTPAAGGVTGVAFNSVNLIAPYVPAAGSNIPTATVGQATAAHMGTVEIHPNGNAELQGAFTNSNNVRLDATIRIS